MATKHVDITLLCHKCDRETPHQVLRMVVEEWEFNETEPPYYGVHGVDRYFIVKCRDCKEFAFLKRAWFSEDFPGDGPTETRYPHVSVRKKPSWLANKTDVPSGLVELLHEIYSALDVDAIALAAMGLRSLLERLMVHLVGDQGTFDDKIGRMVLDEHIAGQLRPALQKVIAVGNATVHRAHKVSLQDLVVMLGLVESLLEQIYVHASAVNALPSPPARVRGKIITSRGGSEE
jgi:hypothetical protein